ncbi:cysteine-rich CWC family protein [Pseudomonas sp. M30-35]|uniref:cysteine-rich CWC family protein n=1 Tax=Pseudomonas sp. M30-35 TaxID=1981174 RepID=UPI000B3C90E8|nr:cysteine-rich CWC family protein [Pseudomonas sp. M30-35]ARU87503.1 DNA or RNA helicase of superfamily II [Pseudomonas sp. M30-35]
MNNSASTCPLCGQLNQCAQAGVAAPVKSCWCFAERISPEVLKKIPAGIDRSCICPRCAKGFDTTEANHAVQPATTGSQQ